MLVNLESSQNDLIVYAQFSWQALKNCREQTRCTSMILVSNILLVCTPFPLNIVLQAYPSSFFTATYPNDTKLSRLEAIAEDFTEGFQWLH